jgi:hypothetical protein
MPVDEINELIPMLMDMHLAKVGEHLKHLVKLSETGVE